MRENDRDPQFCAKLDRHFVLLAGLAHADQVGDLPGQFAPPLTTERLDGGTNCEVVRDRKLRRKKNTRASVLPESLATRAWEARD